MNKAETKPEDKPLTMKQRSFVENYFANGFNGQEAARAAGYKGTDNYLARVASENVRKCNVALAIERKEQENKAKTDITTDNLVQRAINLLEDNETPKGVQARVIETLMKYKGMLTERRIIENVDRQRELTEAEQIEAKRLAIQLMNEQKQAKTA